MQCMCNAHRRVLREHPLGLEVPVALRSVVEGRRLSQRGCMPKLAAELETLKTNSCLCVGTEKESAYGSSSVSPLRNKKEAKSQTDSRYITM